MIKANELRIGNIVKSKTLGIKNAIITGVAPSGNCFLKETTTVDTIEKLEPIPVTSDWLMIFGAQDFDGFYKMDADDNKSLIIDFDEDRIRLNYYVSWGAGKMPTNLGSFEIFYIHQLQNLFFALTGKELVGV